MANPRPHLTKYHLAITNPIELNNRVVDTESLNNQLKKLISTVEIFFSWIIFEYGLNIFWQIITKTDIWKLRIAIYGTFPNYKLKNNSKQIF